MASNDITIHGYSQEDARKDTMRPTVQLLDVTRDQMALRGFEQAVEGIRDLERDIERRFEALEHAIAGCHDNGLEVMVKFTKPVDAAWASWRNKGYAERS